MQDHNKNNHQHGEHSHGDCCAHDHHHDHEHNHKHEHKHEHEHEHAHGECCAHDHSHDHAHGHAHDHAHSHDHGHHDCCDHDHGHQHLSAEECASLVQQAKESSDPVEALDFLLIAGEGFAHMGDAVGTAAVNGLVKKRTATMPALSALKAAQINALQALELALNKENDKAKTALTASVAQLEEFTGEARDEIEPLLADVRKALGGIRSSGLKSLLSRLKF
ncbi:MAG: hypothetical protein RI953_2475 [Pseudomonadota bacterium]